MRDSPTTKRTNFAGGQTPLSRDCHRANYSIIYEVRVVGERKLRWEPERAKLSQSLLSNRPVTKQRECSRKQNRRKYHEAKSFEDRVVRIFKSLAKAKRANAKKIRRRKSILQRSSPLLGNGPRSTARLVSLLVHAQNSKLSHAEGCTGSSLDARHRFT